VHCSTRIWLAQAALAGAGYDSDDAKCRAIRR
jgi:hypothetical protein